MTRFFSVLFIILVGMAPASCNFYGNGGKDHKIAVIIAGSTSVMPFTEKLAEYFIIEHTDYIIDVQGGGSTAGIQACLNKTVNIGLSSRQLKDDEKILNEILICYDGISIVVHPKNPIKNITLKQIMDIYNGRLKNWKELGWIDREIDAITREEGSGTRSSFEDLIMKDEYIYDGIMVQDSNGSVKEVVATDPYAIGYISLGLVDDKVKALSIDGVVPNSQDIKSGSYTIVRPFLFLTNGKPGNEIQAFIDFVLSNDGQNILKKEGLIDIM